MSLLLVPVLLSLFVASNGNNLIQTDCLLIQTETDCNEHSNLCEWASDSSECKFLYQNNHIIGARKLDLVFVSDPNNIPYDMSLFISSMIGKLYDRYDDKENIDLRCSIIPYQNQLIPCSELLNIRFINDLLDDNQNKDENMDLISNVEAAIDVLFGTNAENDRDQYIIPNLHNNVNQDLANSLCIELERLSVFKIYPLLIQWRSFKYDINFDANCPFLQYQPQFIHKINKYDENKSIAQISSIVVSQIHRNSLNPSRFASIDPNCVPFDLAAQAYVVKDKREIWFISGVVDIPTTAPTTEPTKGPTKWPTPSPTPSPTRFPTKSPTSKPTKWPTPYPTSKPTNSPTPAPTKVPTSSPTLKPTKWPTLKPTKWPTATPTKWPTSSPTLKPTKWPTPAPTKWPTTTATKWSTSTTTKWSNAAPTKWSTSKSIIKRRIYNNNRRKLGSWCSAPPPNVDVTAVCHSMENGGTTVTSAQTVENCDQSAANGFDTIGSVALNGDSFDVYDINTGNYFENNIYMNVYQGCILGDGNDQIFIQIGGYNITTEYATSSMQIFDVKTMSWYENRQFPNMNIPRYLHSCTLVADKYTIYVFGGIYHKKDVNHPHLYLDSVEYFNFNPLMHTNKSIKELLCINEYDTNNCYIGGVQTKMDEPKWNMAYTKIKYPRISAKILIPSQYKIFLIGGYGYSSTENGALQSIEIYDMIKNEMLCNKDMGPRLITARASFTAGIYEDEFGYTCLHFIGGRTGVGCNFTKLPLVRSCEKMCFPTNTIDDYIDNMYNIFYVDTDVGVDNVYNKWIIIASIIIVLLVMCVVMLFIKTKNQSKGDQQQGVNENTPLLMKVNNI